MNNGAASPFAQSGAFGNNRRGARSLYNASLGLIFRNSLLDARSFSLTGQDTPKPGYSQMQGLASFGGPLKIPHLVPRNGPNLTVNYQWMRNRNANTATSRMPTADERIGDFSQSLNSLGTARRRFIDPIDRTAVPRQRDSAEPISPQALALLRFYPLPNFDASSRYNYQIPLVGSTHSGQSASAREQGRSDARTASAAVSACRARARTAPTCSASSIPRGSLGINAQVNWMHRFTQRMFVNSGYQFSRLSSRVDAVLRQSRERFRAGRNHGQQSGAGQLGSAGALLRRRHRRPFRWPVSRPITTRPARFRARCSGRAARTTSPSAATSGGSNSISFRSRTRAARSRFTGAAAGSDFAGFLLGVPDTSSIAFGNADKYLRARPPTTPSSPTTGGVSPALTINVGLRWEYNSPITERYGRLVNLDIAPGFRAIAPVVAASATGPLTGQRYPDSLVHPDKTRVSAAHRHLLAALPGVVDGGSRRLRRLLRHVGLHADRQPDGAAIAALEEPERAEQRRQSADAGQRIQRAAQRGHQHLRGRSEFPRRLRRRTGRSRCSATCPRRW